MKKLTLLFICFLALSPRILHAAEPSYAKWGQIAIQEAKKKYNATIVDYAHIGRVSINPTLTQEKFKLWLKSENKEFGVYVTIQFETSTERLKSIKMVETGT
jgi:hypothetical protein